MVIVDTSVVFKWFEESEKDRDKANELLVGHINKSEEIIVPDLLFYEITNAWSTKTSLSTEEVSDNLSRLQKYSLIVHKVNFSLLNAASDFCKKYKISVYDAAYAVLAKEKGCDLITADAKFVRQVNLSYVKLLS